MPKLDTQDLNDNELSRVAEIISKITFMPFPDNAVTWIYNFLNSNGEIKAFSDDFKGSQAPIAISDSFTQKLNNQFTTDLPEKKLAKNIGQYIRLLQTFEKGNKFPNFSKDQLKLLWNIGKKLNEKNIKIRDTGDEDFNKNMKKIFKNFTKKPESIESYVSKIEKSVNKLDIKHLREIANLIKKYNASSPSELHNNIQAHLKQQTDPVLNPAFIQKFMELYNLLDKSKSKAKIDDAQLIALKDLSEILLEKNRAEVYSRIELNEDLRQIITSLAPPPADDDQDKAEVKQHRSNVQDPDSINKTSSSLQKITSDKTKKKEFTWAKMVKRSLGINSLDEIIETYNEPERRNSIYLISMTTDKAISSKQWGLITKINEQLNNEDLISSNADSNQSLKTILNSELSGDITTIANEWVSQFNNINANGKKAPAEAELKSAKAPEVADSTDTADIDGAQRSEENPSSGLLDWGYNAVKRVYDRIVGTSPEAKAKPDKQEAEALTDAKPQNKVAEHSNAAEDNKSEEVSIVDYMGNKDVKNCVASLIRIYRAGDGIASRELANRLKEYGNNNVDPYNAAANFIFILNKLLDKDRNIQPDNIPDNKINFILTVCNNIPERLDDSSVDKQLIKFLTSSNDLSSGEAEQYIKEYKVLIKNRNDRMEKLTEEIVKSYKKKTKTDLTEDQKKLVNIAVDILKDIHKSPSEIEFGAIIEEVQNNNKAQVKSIARNLLLMHQCNEINEFDGGNCLFDAIANGLMHSVSTKTMRNEQLQKLLNIIDHIDQNQSKLKEDLKSLEGKNFDAAGYENLRISLARQLRLHAGELVYDQLLKNSGDIQVRMNIEHSELSHFLIHKLLSQLKLSKENMVRFSENMGLEFSGLKKDLEGQENSTQELNNALTTFINDIVPNFNNISEQELSKLNDNFKLKEFLFDRIKAFYTTPENLQSYRNYLQTNKMYANHLQAKVLIENLNSELGLNIRFEENRNGSKPFVLGDSFTIEFSGGAHYYAYVPKSKEALSAATMAMGQPSPLVADKDRAQKTAAESAAVAESPALESAAPEPAAPKSAAPKSAAPKSAAPKSAAPEPAAPKSAAPEPAAPKSAASKSAAPETAAPKSPAPKSPAPKSPAPKSPAPTESDTNRSGNSKKPTVAPASNLNTQYINSFLMVANSVTGFSNRSISESAKDTDASSQQKRDRTSVEAIQRFSKEVQFAKGQVSTEQVFEEGKAKIELFYGQSNGAEFKAVNETNSDTMNHFGRISIQKTASEQAKKVFEYQINQILKGQPIDNKFVIRKGKNDSYTKMVHAMVLVLAEKMNRNIEIKTIGYKDAPKTWHFFGSREKNFINDWLYNGSKQENEFTESILDNLVEELNSLQKLAINKKYKTTLSELKSQEGQRHHVLMDKEGELAGEGEIYDETGKAVRQSNTPGNN